MLRQQTDGIAVSQSRKNNNGRINKEEVAHGIVQHRFLINDIGNREHQREKQEAKQQQLLALVHHGDQRNRIRQSKQSEQGSGNQQPFRDIIPGHLGGRDMISLEKNFDLHRELLGNTQGLQRMRN